MKYSRQKAPLLAGIIALLLCVDPVASVFHLLTQTHRHAWCEAHQHIVHVDPHGEPVGASDETDAAIWDATGPTSFDAEECGVLKAMRGKLAGPISSSTIAAGEKTVCPSIERFCRSADVLSKAPKHGPPYVS